MISNVTTYLAMMEIDDEFAFRATEEAPSSIERLQRAWISERTSPEILPYESRLLETISTRLKEQVRKNTTAANHQDRLDRRGIAV